MNRISTLMVAAGVAVALAAPAIAQNGPTMGTVVNGNTTTVFKAANTSDIDMHKLTMWNAFATAHPKVASQLAQNPKLITDDAYANKHPQLGQFFSSHPEVRQAMAANPGNYVAIPPRPGE